MDCCQKNCDGKIVELQLRSIVSLNTWEIAIPEVIQVAELRLWTYNTASFGASWLFSWGWGALDLTLSRGHTDEYITTVHRLLILNISTTSDHIRTA